MKQLQVLIKPASSACNLRCRYCFYEDESNCREIKNYGIMSAEIRKALIENALSCAEDSCIFAFQGGEPVLAGLEWFQDFIEKIQSIVGDSFEYGVMPVPVITEETNENALGKSVILGGQPDIIFGMNKALEEDEEKYAAALDFVQYMSSPEIQAKLAEEINRIPLATTVELPERLAGFTITEEPLRMPWYTGVNEQWRNYFHRTGQEFLSDAITAEEMAETLNKSFGEVIASVEGENGWSAENNYGMEQGNES